MGSINLNGLNWEHTDFHLSNLGLLLTLQENMFMAYSSSAIDDFEYDASFVNLTKYKRQIIKDTTILSEENVVGKSFYFPINLPYFSVKQFPKKDYEKDVLSVFRLFLSGFAEGAVCIVSGNSLNLYDYIYGSNAHYDNDFHLSSNFRSYIHVLDNTIKQSLHNPEGGAIRFHIDSMFYFLLCSEAGNLSILRANNSEYNDYLYSFKQVLERELESLLKV